MCADQTLLIAKEELRTLIPHQGTMCLLDGVQHWDDEQIVCISMSHRERDNPLRSNDQLAALHAFEYGAQAVAVHGGLRARAAGQRAAPGYLAALRNGVLHCQRLDLIEQALQVTAKRRLSNESSYIYDTQVDAEGVCIAAVRVTIILLEAGF